MFETELLQLATIIRDRVVKLKESRSLETQRVVAVRRRDFTLKYQEDFGFAYFTPQRSEEDTWGWRDSERFQDSEVRALDEYKSLVANGVDLRLLETFARAISLSSFRGLADAELGERVSTLGRELAGLPIVMKVAAFIDGVAIDDSPLVITDKFLLRKPTPEDVKERVLHHDYGGRSFPLPEAWFRAVGEFTVDAISTGNAQREFLRVVEALCLFRIGGIAANRYRVYSTYSSWPEGVSGGSSRHTRFTYTLNNSDVHRLGQFLRDLTPLIPDPFEVGKAMSEKEIAFMRYREALFQMGPAEQVITSAITALEALFLGGEPELTHRLAQRVAVFLRILGTRRDSQTTYQDMKEGYKIRSAFIHGGSLEPKRRPQANALAPILVDYTRECVLGFLQITTPKQEI